MRMLGGEISPAERTLWKRAEWGATGLDGGCWLFACHPHILSWSMSRAVDTVLIRPSPVPYECP